MKISLNRFLVQVVLGALMAACLAVLPAHSTPSSFSEASAAEPSPFALNVDAKAWALYDVTSDRLLGGANADERVEPASITKLMTAYLTFSALRNKQLTLEQVIRPSNAIRIVKTDESRMFLQPNKPVTVDELIHGLLIQSGNDAAIALAEAVGGTEDVFVTMMNRQAKVLGMSGTHFANTNGIPDPQHYTTALDLVVLGKHIVNDFPEYYPMFSERSFVYDNIKQYNRNRLLYMDSSVDGMKTGHTKSSGFSLVSSATRPLPDGQGGRRLIAVLLGVSSEGIRARESLRILDYGFQAFSAKLVYKKSQVVQTAEVFEGTKDAVDIGVTRDTYASFPSASGDSIQTKIELNEYLVAPIAKGQPVGVLRVLSAGGVVGAYPLVALTDVPQAGFWGRQWGMLRVWWKRGWSDQGV